MSVGIVSIDPEVQEVGAILVPEDERSTGAKASLSEPMSVSDDGVEISLGVVGSYAGNSGSGAVGRSVPAPVVRITGLVRLRVRVATPSTVERDSLSIIRVSAHVHAGCA